MQPVRFALCSALIVVLGACAALAQGGACGVDPCFAAAGLADECCLLNNPAIAQLSGQEDLSQAGGALAAYLDTACTDTCYTKLFNEYRGCLAGAPIDQSLVQDYLPPGLCELTCMSDAGLDFSTQLTDCSKLNELPMTCRMSAVGVEGMIGAQLQKIFQNCNIPTSQNVTEVVQDATVQAAAGTQEVTPAAAAAAAIAPAASAAAAAAPAAEPTESLDEVPAAAAPTVTAQQGPQEGEAAVAVIPSTGATALKQEEQPEAIVRVPVNSAATKSGFVAGAVASIAALCIALA